MESIEKHLLVPQKGSNHLSVAFCYCDDDYKRDTLYIPEEYADIEIIDINIEKVIDGKPVHHSTLFRMSSWLLQQFEEHDNAVFTFICSTDDLFTNHPDILPQTYRWNLFDRLFKRKVSKSEISILDVVVGPDGYQSRGRAFYRENHAPIVHIVASYIQNQQQQY